MNKLPIRLRLSLLYFGMFASAALLLTLTCVWMLHRTVDASGYHDLQERAEDVQAILAHQNPSQGIEQTRQNFTVIYGNKDDGKWLQIRDEAGNWIYRSSRMIIANPELPAPGRLPREGLRGEFRQDVHRVRTLAYPIAVHGIHYSVQTGLSLNRSAALLSTFHSDLLFLVPIVIFLAAIGGHLMSRNALRPVATLAAQARLINDRNLEMRLPVPEAEDEIRELTQTLNQMLERIDKAFSSVRAFTGNASHELRTPISLLRAEIEVALHRPRSASEYRATLICLHEETVRMTGLIENLLSLARADGGAETMALIPISLPDLFSRLEKIWKPTMQRALLDFRVDTLNEQIAVLGDPVAVPRLLSILLDNASKYTPPGGAVVLRAAYADSHIVLEVRDSGIGIPAEHLPHVFERFYRAQQEVETAHRGSGLGLALGKWIAERHDTQLVAESIPGHGSRFSFALKPTAVTPEAHRRFGSSSTQSPSR